MSRSVIKALKSVAVLVSITAVCVGLLAVCNMFFPKYVPTLDSATAALINSVCATGRGDGEAASDGYIVMLAEDDYGVSLTAHNKANRSAKINAVYCEPKGDNAGAYIIECSAAGRDGDIVLLIAYKSAAIVGATVKKQGESYWHKLPDTLFDTLDGKTGTVDLVGEIGKTGATVSLTGVQRAVNGANSFAAQYDKAIKAAIDKLAASEGAK